MSTSERYLTDEEIAEFISETKRETGYTRAEQLGADGGFAKYRLKIEPALSILGHRRNSRVFQDKTVRRRHAAPAMRTVGYSRGKLIAASFVGAGLKGYSESQKKAADSAAFCIWCPGPDSNWHAFRRRILNPQNSVFLGVASC